MFRDLIEWNRRRRAWKAAHAEAWRGAGERGGDGLTAIQRRCETVLVRELAAVGCVLAERRIERPAAGHEYIRARVEGTSVSVWIHDDTAGFDSPARDERFEEWDFATPDEFITAFCRAVVQAVRPAP
jgi:hypothetical protein